MISEVYEPLVSAGAPDEKARAAATAVAAESNLEKLDTKLDRVAGGVATLKTDTAVLKWMCGTIAALCLGIIVKLLFG